MDDTYTLTYIGTCRLKQLGGGPILSALSTLLLNFGYETIQARFLFAGCYNNIELDNPGTIHSLSHIPC